MIDKKDASGNILYNYLFNGHGDVVQLTGTDGNVIKSYDYDAFGVEKNPDVNDTNVFRYCGEYFDKETGTIYLRARYYDPEIGRFITEDSYWGKDKDPLSLNLYTYCENDPVDMIDPDGHFAFVIPIIATAPEWVPIAGGIIATVVSAVVVEEVVIEPMRDNTSDERVTLGIVPLLSKMNTAITNLQNKKQISQAEAKPNVSMAKGGVQNKRQTGLPTDPKVLEEMYKNPNTSTELKQRIKTQQKAIGQRKSSQQNTKKKKK